MKLTEFRQDSKKANEGVVREFGDGAYIRVARANNPEYDKEMRKLMTPYKNFRRGKISPEIIDEVVSKAIAKTILLEMVGFTDDAGDITGIKGSVIENTYDNRLRILQHPDYTEFRELVASISQDFNEFRVETEQEEAGNSENSSAGAGAGGESNVSSSKLSA